MNKQETTENTTSETIYLSYDKSMDDCELLDLLKDNQFTDTPLGDIVMYFSKKTGIGSSVSVGFVGFNYGSDSLKFEDVKRWKVSLDCE